MDQKTHPPPKGTKRKRNHEQQSGSKISDPKPEASHVQKTLKHKSRHLQHFRTKLPIWGYSQTIRDALKDRNVLVLSGETGSGKSTQTPQFLMSEDWCTGIIAITQPRRVAAISLARRVAEEVGTPLGSSSPASKVGYSVRFDNSTSPNTKIKFLTEGMLLKEMLADPSLNKYSAIIVDEVHERSVNVDLLLGFLQRMVVDKTSRKENPLKVVVMSATADIQSLVKFFEEGYKTSYDSNPFQHVSVCNVPGRQFPVETIYLSTPSNDFVESALKSIFQIHYKQPLPGDILVFLTGQDTVESLERLVNDYALGMGPEVPSILTLPLFAALPQTIQQRVFQPAPPKTRKVIIATNIAETSVTVPGVRYVIDCGKMKMKQYRSKLGLDSLLVKPISKSSAIQRKGRAGREAPGICYRLYTEEEYNALADDTVPEILRCDLSDAILSMKARGIQDVQNFPFLNPPSRSALEKALLHLLLLGAFDSQGSISETGIQIAKLPLTPSLGRVLIEATKYGPSCLIDALDIIACLTVENVFLHLTTEESIEAASEARKDLFHRDGDHITLLNTIRSYAAENSDRKAWCARYFVSHRAMQNVMNVRKQLLMQAKQLKLLPTDAEFPKDADGGGQRTESRNEELIKCVLRGFPTQIARLTADGSYRSLSGNQVVAIHPSSVLFGRKIEAILFTEYVFTTKSYARGVSAVQLKWIDELFASS